MAKIKTTTEGTRMHGRHFIRALMDAGIIKPGEYVTGVTIEADFRKAVTLTVHRFADDRLLPFEDLERAALAYAKAEEEAQS